MNRKRYSPAMELTVDSLLTGCVQRFADGTSSAIAKHRIDGPRNIHWLGIEGDQQADLSVHGGRDKAVHHYPFDHYEYWRTTLGALPLLEAPGAFGENISTSGLTEDFVCIGDRYRLGSALVEIAQGRQPCWKQAHRLMSPDIVALMVATRRCGWYYRVIEQGAVKPGDTLSLLDCPHPEWSVARVIGLLIAGEGKKDRAAVRALATLDVLAENWRARALRLAA